MKIEKEISLQTFITMLGPNPDNKGHYRFEISKYYRIESAIQKGLDLNRNICLVIEIEIFGLPLHFVKGQSQFLGKTGEAKTYTQGNFFCLMDPKDIHPLVNGRRKSTVS